MVQLHSGLKQIRINRFAESPGADFSNLDQTAAEVKQVIESENLQSDYCILGVDGSHCFFRHLFFPFPKKEKIRQVLDFELEPTLPFDAQEFLSAFIKTEQQKGTLHGVLAGAMETTTMDQILAAFQNVGLDPDEIIPDVSTLAVIFQEFLPQTEDDALILDLGDSRTNLAYCRKGIPIYFRSFSVFSQTLSRNLPQKQTAADGGGRLDDTASHSRPSSGDQRLHKLIKEIELTLIASNTDYGESPLKNIVLFGEGSLDAHEIKALETTFQVRTMTVHDFIPSGSYPDDFHVQQAPRYASTVCLALQGRKKKSGLDFRKGPYTKMTAYTKWKKPLGYVAAACALLFVTWIATLGFKIYLLEKQNIEVQQKIYAVFSRTLPELQREYQPSQYASILQSKINSLSSQKKLLSQEEYLNFIDSIKTFSSFLSDNQNIIFSHVVFDSSRIMLNGIANSYNTIEDAKNALLQAKEFKTVSIKGAKSNNQGNSINFSLEIESK